MDIKTLLLKSLSLKIPISGSRRIYQGKSCFVIKYVINGKFLSIKNIKNTKRRITWSQLIKYYNSIYKIRWRKKNNVTVKGSAFTNTSKQSFEDKSTITEDIYRHMGDVQTETSKINFKNKEISTQTVDVQKHTKEIQTEILKTSSKFNEIKKLGSATNLTSAQNQALSFTSTAQQTIASVKFSRTKPCMNHKTISLRTTKSIQTESNSECKWVQCKRSTHIKATNTEINTRDSAAQVQNDLFDVRSCEEATKLLSLPLKDFEVLIYMLNEIGETVVNQTHILNNNTEMMKQIMQINILKSSRHMKKQTSRSIEIQTDQLPNIEMKNNFCQTEGKYTKSRKLLLFKGLNNQHNIN